MRSYISTIAVPAAAMALAKGATLAVLLAFAPGAQDLMRDGEVDQRLP